eukprot:CAMPEP_0119397310 /NCGR_PEP_ID=MMETSP1334-20130426/140264_1 /TAXON_ID=127549 /ORGANISM="Calcidiscus leptoporus, Strain RCC1130" /LENGTH=103 /DNA_ID=CAMNT_0007421145 /DNA_START=334 /DNA_END=642 /DNA_ORIENTATION=+
MREQCLGEGERSPVGEGGDVGSRAVAAASAPDARQVRLRVGREVEKDDLISAAPAPSTSEVNPRTARPVATSTRGGTSRGLAVADAPVSSARRNAVSAATLLP